MLIATPVLAEETVNNEPVEIDNSFSFSDYKKPWMDDFQIHGFLSQGLFSTSGNNVYGKSKDSVSAGSTELGLNLSYQALDRLSFAIQGLYRRAGESTGKEGEVSLDFAFMDYILFLSTKKVVSVYEQVALETLGAYITKPEMLLPLTRRFSYLWLIMNALVRSFYPWMVASFIQITILLTAILLLLSIWG